MPSRVVIVLVTEVLAAGWASRASDALAAAVPATNEPRVDAAAIPAAPVSRVRREWLNLRNAICFCHGRALSERAEW